MNCPFCGRIERGEYDACLRSVGRFAPLNPVTRGHMLFVPLQHVQDASEMPWLTGDVFEEAARYAAAMNRDFNLITSTGDAATQTIRHLHVHYVPRAAGDGLPLPWTGQKR